MPAATGILPDASIIAAGEMLAAMATTGKGGDRKSSNTKLLGPSLDDLGITKMQSHRWQRRGCWSIFEMWLACYSQQEIADAENVDKATVNRICCEFADLQKCNKSDKASAEHATDFDVAIPLTWTMLCERFSLDGFPPPGCSIGVAVDHPGGEMLAAMEKQEGARTKRGNTTLPRLDVG